MKTLTRKLRPPIKRHGGKAYLANRIVALMPEHRRYCEPFIGGGSCLLNKPKAELEVAGDLDAGLVNLWESLRTNPLDFAALAKDIDYSEVNFRGAFEAHRDGIQDEWGFPDRAVAYLVRNRFSRGGLGKTFAWSDRLRGGQPGDANAWDTIRAELPAIAERVKGVEFRCVDALTLIREFDGPGSLIYADPPYLHETRTARKAYGEFEMKREDHVALLRMLNGAEAAVMLSGYRSDLYDDFLAGWELHEFDLPNHSGQGKAKQRRVECVWIKPADQRRAG